MFPDFVKNLPRVDVKIDGLNIYLLRGEQSVALIEVEKDLLFPLHRHGAQWGVVVAGEIVLTLNSEKKTYRGGQTYFIPANALHGAELKMGTRLLEFYEEPGRFET